MSKSLDFLASVFSSQISPEKNPYVMIWVPNGDKIRSTHLSFFLCLLDIDEVVSCSAIDKKGQGCHIYYTKKSTNSQ